MTRTWESKLVDGRDEQLREAGADEAPDGSEGVTQRLGVSVQEELLEQLRDPAGDGCWRAVWALGKVASSDERVIKALTEMIRQDEAKKQVDTLLRAEHPTDKEEAAKKLEEMVPSEPAVAAALLMVLTLPSNYSSANCVRRNAASALRAIALAPRRTGPLRNTILVAPLARAMKEEHDESVRCKLAEALAAILDIPSLGQLTTSPAPQDLQYVAATLTEDVSNEQIEQAAVAFQGMGFAAVPGLLSAAGDEDVTLSRKSVELLLRLCEHLRVRRQELRSVLKDQSTPENERCSVFIELMQLDSEHVVCLHVLADDRLQSLGLLARHALVKFNHAGVGFLVAALSSDDVLAVWWAAWALRKLARTAADAVRDGDDTKWELVKALRGAVQPLERLSDDARRGTGSLGEGASRVSDAVDGALKELARLFPEEVDASELAKSAQTGQSVGEIAVPPTSRLRGRLKKTEPHTPLPEPEPLARPKSEERVAKIEAAVEGLTSEEKRAVKIEALFEGVPGDCAFEEVVSGLDQLQTSFRERVAKQMQRPLTRRLGEIITQGRGETLEEKKEIVKRTNAVLEHFGIAVRCRKVDSGGQEVVDAPSFLVAHPGYNPACGRILLELHTGGKRPVSSRTLSGLMPLELVATAPQRLQELKPEAVASDEARRHGQQGQRR